MKTDCDDTDFPPQMLKLSDKDFENLGLTAGARKKLRVNLDVLRYIYNLVAAVKQFGDLTLCNSA